MPLLRFLAAAPAVIGLASLFGWALDIAALKSVFSGLPAMQPNTALCFLLQGCALWLAQANPSGKRRAAIAWLALAGALVGLLTLLEYAKGWDLGIDQAVFRDDPGSLAANPGRMSPVTAANFMMLGVALALIAARRCIGAAHALALGAMAHSWLIAIGYLYHQQYVGAFPSAAFTSMALHTALAFLLLGAGVLFSPPAGNLARLVTAVSTSGSIARRLLPAIILLPPFMGWVRLLGERAGFYDFETGLAIFATSNSVVLFLIVWGGASWMAKAESALREQELFARSVLDALSAHIAVIDAEGTILEVNERWRLFGLENGSAGGLAGISKGANYLEVCAKAERDGCEEASKAAQGIFDVLAGLLPVFEMEYPCHSPEERRWFTMRATRFPGEGARKIVIAHENVTERKEAKENLRTSEERLRRAVTDAPFPAIIHAEDGEIVLVNEAWTDITGYAPGEIPTIEAWTEKAYGDGAEAMREHIGGLYGIEGRVGGGGERLIRTKDGTKRTWEFSSSPLGALPDGRRLVISMAADVTERKKAEEGRRLALEESESRKAMLDLLLDSMGEGVVACDEEGRFLIFNPAAKRLVGMGPPDASMEEWPERFGVFLPDGRTPFPSEDLPLARAMRGEVSDGVEQLVRNPGQPEGVSLEISGRPLVDAKGRARGGVCVLRDITGRKAAEKKLRELLIRREELERIVNRSPAVAFLWSASEGWPVEYVSENFSSFGYSPAEFAAARTPYASVMRPDDVPRVEAQVRGFCANPERESFSLEYRLIDAGGGERWVEENSWIRRGPDGQATHFDGLIVDITERKAAEHRLLASEARFRALAESMPAIVWTAAPDGRVEYFNKRWTQATGIGLEDSLGPDWLEAVAPEDSEAARQGWNACLESGEEYEDELRLKNPGGPPLWHLVRAVPDHGADGKVAKWFGSCVNIEDRKQAEAALKRDLDRLDLLNRVTRLIAERQDLDSIFKVAASQVEKRLPVAFSLFALLDPGSDLLVVGGGEPSDRRLAERLDLKAGKPLFVGENGLRRCAKQSVLLYEPEAENSSSLLIRRMAQEAGLRSVVAAPLGGKRGERAEGIFLAARREPNAFESGDCEFLEQLSAHVALAVNQTQLLRQLKDAYEDLRATQKAITQQERMRAMGQMASGIAHDVNNALGPVSLYAEMLLERETGLSEKGRERVEKIVASTESIAQTIARLRNFYRRSDGDESLVSVDLGKILREALDLTRPRWRDMPQKAGAAIEAKAEIEPGLPPVMCVPSEIRDALTNLIFNAVDAMPRGGRLSLRAWRESRGVALEVQDTGTGMEEEARRRCLEPFFTTKKEQGTGLGLAMVYGMVQRHGAIFEIDSEPGRGTSMRLVFPIRTPSQELAAPSFSSEPLRPSGPLRLLCVDDDPLIRESLEEMLVEDGHSVQVADGGAAGIKAFLDSLSRGAPFDAVVTDLGMPYVDGREVIHAVKKAAPRTPVILLTGWGARMKLEGGAPDQADFVLGKPPRLRELRETLARAEMTTKNDPEIT